MRKKIGLLTASIVALAMLARAGIITYTATLVNESALAYNNSYPLNLNSNGIGTLSAQAYYSTATVANATFQDGSRSTGSFTVLNFAALASARATNQITVLTTSSLTGATIAVPGFVFYNGIDWATGATTHDTAVSLASALSAVPYLSVSVVGSVVYATATAGSYYNSFTMASNNAGLSVASPLFTGGQDNASIAINGVVLRQGFGWTAATSNAATATSLASAINAATSLSSRLTAQASGAVITATSTINGATFNYRLQTSTPTALSASGANMTNGVDANFALGSTQFSSIGSNGLTLALPVLYTGTPAIGGLSAGTTYYAVPGTGNTFALSDSAAHAVAGTNFALITSTNTQIAAHTYTLAPLALTGNASFKWQVSNDNVIWNDLAVSSVTVTPSSAFNSTLWSFGYIGTQYVRLNVVAPTTGGLALRVVLIGTN